MYGDALGYYSYLPATFIHKNLKTIDTTAEIEGLNPGIVRGIKNFKNAYAKNKDGFSVIQYTYGVAAMQSPAFFTVVIYDKLFGNTPTGFERRYQAAIKFMNIFYLFLGLFFCFLSLRYFYSPRISLIASIVLLLGSNLFWFGFLQFGMAHVPQFCLIAVLTWLSIKTAAEFKIKEVLFIAFLLGMISIIRPTDIVFGIIPLVFTFLKCKESASFRKHFYIGLPKFLPLAILFFLIPFLPQFAYWKYVTGEFLFDSYIGYGFNWLKPEIIKGLFGAKNGWFTYTPLMLMAFLGLTFLKMNRSIKLIFFILLPLYIYICYAWFNYYYINGFGSRPMLHTYPIMVFGIASIFSIQKSILKWMAIFLIGCSIFVNLNYSSKAIDGRLFSDESTHAFNRSTFFKRNLNYTDLFLLGSKIPQSSLQTSKCEFLQELILNSDLSIPILKDDLGDNYVKVESKDVYPRGSIVYNVTDKLLDEFSSLKVEATMRFSEHVFMPHDHQKIVMEVLRGDEQMYWECISINDKVGKQEMDISEIEIRSTIINQWDKIAFHFPTDKLEDGDRVKAFVWNPAKRESDFKSLKLFACK